MVLPQSPQMPTQRLSPAVPPGPALLVTPETSKEMDAQAQSPRNVFIVHGGSYCCEESVAHARVPSSVQDPEKTPCPQVGSPLSVLHGSMPGPVRQGRCAKRRLGRRTSPTLAGSTASAPWSLPVCRALTHWQRQCPPSLLPGAFGEAGGDRGGRPGPRDTGHSRVNV